MVTDWDKFEVARRAIDVMNAWFDDLDNNQETDFFSERMNAYTSEPGSEERLLAGFFTLTTMLLGVMTDFIPETPRRILEGCSTSLAKAPGNKRESPQRAIDAMTAYEDDVLDAENNPIFTTVTVFGEELGREARLLCGFVDLISIFLPVIQRKTGTPPRETLQRCLARLDTMDNQRSSPPRVSD